MNKKLGVLFFVGVIALASMGVSFAEDRMVYFNNISYYDNDDATKNIGHVTAYLDQLGDLIVNISGAYPYYEAYVYFTINFVNQSANGDDVVWIKTVDVTNIYLSVMDVNVTYPDGTPILDYTPIYSEVGIDAKLTIKMKDGAGEDGTYGFDVDIKFTDQPPP